VVELLRIGYTRLFEIRVLHHYWLDQGRTVFDQIADQATKTERLLTYDVRRLLAFRPSAASAATITGLRGAFRTTGLGFLVAVPDDAKVPLDATFEFFVTVVAPDYVNYTAQPLARPGITLPTVPALSPQPIVSVVDPVPDPLTGTQRVLRYKANVPVLSNLTGVSRGTDATTRQYLSRDYPARSVDDAAEALVAVNGDVRQRAGDPPNAPLTVVGLQSDLPVFLHQGDVPPITPPAGSVGAPAFGIELVADTPPDVAAVIRLTPRRLTGSPFNFADTDGTPRPRVFEVHLQNRWTTWRYRSKRDGSLTSTEANPLPLTHFGNAGTKQKPSSADLGADLDTQDPPRIIRLVSDIYV
jgi:hypothetical protein